jgi:hypothetical protein
VYSFRGCHEQNQRSYLRQILGLSRLSLTENLISSLVKIILHEYLEYIPRMDNYTFSLLLEGKIFARKN